MLRRRAGLRPQMGGVLEHPAWSDAWAHFGLPQPSRSGGWTGALFDPGFSAHVEQGRYGHAAKKATWLYVCGVPPESLPELRWGHEPDAETTRYWVSWRLATPRMGKSARASGRRQRLRRHQSSKMCWWTSRGG